MIELYSLISSKGPFFYDILSANYIFFVYIFLHDYAEHFSYSIAY